jgi:hypothetical protein
MVWQNGLGTREERFVMTASGLRRIAMAMLLLAGVVGCRTPAPRAAQASLTPPPKPVGKPLMDFARGFGGLPLKPEIVPDSPETLARSIHASLGERLTDSSPRPRVVVDAASLDRLEHLSLDLSGCQVRADYRPRAMSEPEPPQPLFHAHRFEYLASPLRYARGATSLTIRANDVTFGRLTDQKGRVALALMDVGQGEMEFAIPTASLGPILADAASQHSRGGLRISQVKVDVQSRHRRSLDVVVVAQGRWLLLPMKMRMTMTMEIDPSFHAEFSNVVVNGEDVGGKLFAGIAERALQKLEKERRPIASWPDQRVKLQDVEIAVDDHLRFRARFGREILAYTPLE